MTKKLLTEYGLSVNRLEDLVKNQELGPYGCIKSAEGHDDEDGSLRIVRRNTIAGLYGNPTYFFVFNGDSEKLGAEQVIERLGSWRYKLPGEFGADTVNPKRNKRRSSF